MNSDVIDPKEVEKFNQLSDKWWDVKGPFKPLHQLNPLRLRFIQQHINLENKRILDVGCGGGILTTSLSRYSRSVTGIDLAPDAIKCAQNHTQDFPHPPHYICESLESHIQSLNSPYDVVTCMELIEHVPSPHILVAELAKALKPGGDLFISTLNRNLKSFIHAIIGAEYVLKVIPKGTHAYENFIKPSELDTMLSHANCCTKHIQGFKYHPIIDMFDLTNNVSVNYIIHATKEG